MIEKRPDRITAIGAHVHIASSAYVRGDLKSDDRASVMHGVFVGGI